MSCTEIHQAWGRGLEIGDVLSIYFRCSNVEGGIFQDSGCLTSTDGCDTTGDIMAYY